MYAIALIVVVYFYVRFAIWAVKWVSGRYASRQSKWAVGTIAAVIFVLIPTGDEIAGRMYFNHLCETEAGVKVYQTVELPAEFWDEQGEAKFYVDWDSHLGKKYPLNYKQGSYSSLFPVDNAGYEFIDVRTGQVLGEAVDFRYWGGWIRRNFSVNNAAERCIDYTEPSNRLIDRIFVMEH